MKKLLIIPFLLFPSISYSKEIKSDLRQKELEACKNWATLEKVPQEEAIRCLKATIARINEKTLANELNLKQLYNTF